MSTPIINGFSKLSKEDKRSLLMSNKIITDQLLEVIDAINLKNNLYQEKIENLTENFIANFPLSLSIVPNVIINNKLHFVPMVTEESSVVAAASYAAKFWALHGGFKTKVIDEIKIGQIHFTWPGRFEELDILKPVLFESLTKSIDTISENMKKRGGGCKSIEILDFTAKIDNYYQLRIGFTTADAMGANYINSCLEQMAKALKLFVSHHFENEKATVDIIMAILSNYTPDCMVECSVECPMAELQGISGNLNYRDFASKFKLAIDIAHIDPYRAVTHNKGIYNGIDAVVLATGNDFRAVEACGHAYASRNGNYSSLSWCDYDEYLFRFVLRIPIALGSVGGLTSAHPVANLALQILNKPSAAQLMQVAAAIGMANHFAALRALVTNGIQAGHMKMHLSKILQHLNTSEEERALVKKEFSNKSLSFSEISSFLELQRKSK
jgi:hydroxymethylglutaryl-CoA reductase